MPALPSRADLARLPRQLVARLPGRPTRMPRVGLATVRGRSMEPTLHEGDRLLVAWGIGPRPGRLALVSLPDGTAGERPLSVKRVTGRDPDDPQAWWVERDNPREGVDSWQVGAIPDHNVHAVVLTRVPDLRPLARIALVVVPVQLARRIPRRWSGRR